MAGSHVDSLRDDSRIIPIDFPSRNRPRQYAGVVTPHVGHAVDIPTSPEIEQTVQRHAPVGERVAPAASPFRLDIAEVNRRSRGRLRLACLEQQIAVCVLLKALSINGAVRFAQTCFNSPVPDTSEKDRRDARCQLGYSALVVSVVERGVPAETIVQLKGSYSQQ